MICTELHFNYRQPISDGREAWGEEWDTYKVGEKGVIKIKEHSSGWEGDK